MAWFNKNKKGEVKNSNEFTEIPSLPQLPKLPDLPMDNLQFKPNALPRFPSSSLGNKFSQDTIKGAITGEKEEDEETTNESEEVQTMPRLPASPLMQEVPSSMMGGFSERKQQQSYPMRQESQAPMFVRLDKFEENLDVFDKIKRQLVGVEKIFDDIKRTKEQEDKELMEWQTKLQTMKQQLDKIDKDIFSKI